MLLGAEPFVKFGNDASRIEEDALPVKQSTVSETVPFLREYSDNPLAQGEQGRC